MKPYAPPEAEVQRNGILLLQAMRWHVERRNVGGMIDERGQFVQFARKGQADTYGWIPILGGRHFELEFKRAGAKPTILQTQWLRQCWQDGAIAFWVSDTKRLEEIAREVIRGASIRFLDGYDFEVYV